MRDRYETLQVHREDGVVWLTLNRPERLNALNARLVDDLSRQKYCTLIGG
jgi:enoyl-CoA hydratase/carnithine racemase